jgi:predicted kinase
VLSLDLLETRHRERVLLSVCIESGLRFVVDNTNPTRAERQVYIQEAKAAGFRVVGYYFRSRVEDCKRRNEERPAARQVPLRGILGTAGRMELPSPGEGFDELHDVGIGEDGGFGSPGRSMSESGTTRSPARKSRPDAGESSATWNCR